MESNDWKRIDWKNLHPNLRPKSDEVAKAAKTWNRQGKQNVGRPKITCRRSVIAQAETNRKFWNDLKLLAIN